MLLPACLSSCSQNLLKAMKSGFRRQGGVGGLGALGDEVRGVEVVLEEGVGWRNC